jgi:tRNA A-37 threonylcarbamoyl transferase component Bud32
MISILKNNTLLAIADEYKELIYQDLLSDFRDVLHRDIKGFSGRCTQFSYACGKERLHVRSMRRGGLILGRLLGNLYMDRARPFNELRVTERLKEAGVKVAPIIAIKAVRIARLFYRFVVVTKEIQDTQDLYTFIRNASWSERAKVSLKVGEAVWHMHQAGVVHGDLQLRNILVRPQKDEPEIYFIDLDRSRIVQNITYAQRIKNIRRLHRSLEKWLGDLNLVTRQDKLRFLKGYLKNLDQDLKEMAKRCTPSFLPHRLMWWIQKILRG